MANGRICYGPQLSRASAIRREVPTELAPCDDGSVPNDAINAFMIKDLFPPSTV